MIIFITGGVRSGKSKYAEERALQQALKQKSQKLYYIATSQVYDQEMRARVNKHQQQRLNSGAEWILYEQATDIHKLLPLFHQGDVVLIDCLTTLLSNELFKGWEKREVNWKKDDFVKAVGMKFKRLLTEMAAASYSVFFVSNELSYDLPVNDQSTNVYIKELGRLHQFIVSIASEAIVVESGLACFKKGRSKYRSKGGSKEWSDET